MGQGLAEQELGTDYMLLVVICSPGNRVVSVTLSAETTQVRPHTVFLEGDI